MDIEPLEGSLDTYVESTLRRWSAPGVVIAVVRRERSVSAKGYGTRRLGEDVTPDSYTLFHIASHTKPITSAAMAMLVDEGSLRWDDRVRDYIPEFRFADKYVSDNATIRDLLTHRLGLPALWNRLGESDYSFADLIQDLAEREPESDFRGAHRYTNTGYAIAGEVIRRVSGCEWEDFVTQRLFIPLGMEESYPSAERLMASGDAETAIVNSLLPVSYGGTIATGINRVFNPAGGCITNAIDIAKWMVMQIQAGTHEGSRVIGEESMREMHTPQVAAAPLPFGAVEYDWTALHNPLGHLTTYGLGWFSHEYRGRRIDEHTGLGANRSSIAVIPEEGLGVAVCTNASTPSPDAFKDLRMTSALKLRIIDQMIGAPTSDWSEIFWRIHLDQVAKSERALRRSRG